MIQGWNRKEKSETGHLEGQRISAGLGGSSRISELIGKDEQF